MLARPCTCERAQVVDDSDTCNTCGRAPRSVVHASTWKLALTLAEISLGARRAGDFMGRHGRAGKT